MVRCFFVVGSQWYRDIIERAKKEKQKQKAKALGKGKITRLATTLLIVVFKSHRNH